MAFSFINIILSVFWNILLRFEVGYTTSVHSIQFSTLLIHKDSSWNVKCSQMETLLACSSLNVEDNSVHAEGGFTCGVRVPTRCVMGSFSTTSSLQASLTLDIWNCRSSSCRKTDCPRFTFRPRLFFTREPWICWKRPSKRKDKHSLSFAVIVLSLCGSGPQQWGNEWIYWRNCCLVSHYPVNVFIQTHLHFFLILMRDDQKHCSWVSGQRKISCSLSNHYMRCDIWKEKKNIITLYIVA